MTIQQLEARIAALEAELVQIKRLLLQHSPQQHPWWDSVFASFADCPELDEAERLGQEWRSSQR